MVSLAALWMPILLAAVIVFIASAIMHMVLPYHRSDYKALPSEESITAALRSAGVTRGLYMFPHCAPNTHNTPEAKAKFLQGPVGTITINPPGAVNMGKYLALWFVYCVLVALFTAYAASLTLPAGTEYMRVFRVVGAVAFMSFSLANFADSIWKSQPWSNTVKAMVDGLIFALLTAGTFGWLWPK